MSIEIRRATRKDSAGIARVQVDSYLAAYAGIFPLAYLEHFTYAEQEQAKARSKTFTRKWRRSSI